ncbi:hypothetical protein C8R45DRAFT_1127586 [Mycena sanguinolenta]|nr:hypothetical protein C8R45DRAFT_1127586 [Mycena sanguinolenta]
MTRDTVIHKTKTIQEYICDFPSQMLSKSELEIDLRIAFGSGALGTKWTPEAVNVPVNTSSFVQPRTNIEVFGVDGLQPVLYENGTVESFGRPKTQNFRHQRDIAACDTAAENVLALAGLEPGLPRAPGRQNQPWGQKKIAGARICIGARIRVLASFISTGFLANGSEKNMY